MYLSFPHTLAQAVSLAHNSTTQLLHQHLECTNPLCVASYRMLVCLPPPGHWAPWRWGWRVSPMRCPHGMCILWATLCKLQRRRPGPTLRGLTSLRWTEACGASVRSSGVTPWIPGWRITVATLSRSHTSAVGLQVSGKTVQFQNSLWWYSPAPAQLCALMHH